MRRRGIGVAAILFAASPVWADDVVVCDPQAAVPNQVTSYQRQMDPYKSGAVSNPNALIWSLPASSVRPWDGQVPAGSWEHWKCVDTTQPPDGVLDAVKAMTPEEQAVVDAPLLTAQATQAAYEGEIATNDLCTATLEEIDTRLGAAQAVADTDVDTITGASTGEVLTSLKAYLKRSNGRIAGLGKKIARCLKARTGGAQP